jgi:hypothetical protein
VKRSESILSLTGFDFAAIVAGRDREQDIRMAPNRVGNPLSGISPGFFQIFPAKAGFV